MTTHTSKSVTALCLGFPGTTVDNTFGDDVNVHRVGNKMFALINIRGGEIVTLKATTEEVVALVSEHDFVTPGYYMNKKHWITINLSEAFDAIELEELLTGSYRLVLESLPKRLQHEIQADT